MEFKKIDELQDYFENAIDDEFLRFERVQNKRSRRKDIHAFILLDELVPSKGDDIVSCAEHDQIWLDTDVQKLLKVATEEQLIELHRCGVWYSEDVESLSMWV